MMVARWMGSALLAGVLCACSLFAPREEPEGSTVTASPRPDTPPAPLPAPPTAAAATALPPAAAPRPPPVRENQLSPATRSLVEQSHAQIGRGDLPGASATLERALRIEPYNPLLWTELGRLRLAEEDARQAENCARKAMALASGDPSSEAKAGRLLADTLRAQHRNQEAREVEAQPYMSSRRE